MDINEQKAYAQKISARYGEKTTTDLDALMALDRKVKRPADAFAYTFGSIGAVIMGSGMSLVMTDIGATLGMTETMIPGIVIGLVGMAIALVNYPIHKAILKSRRKKYAPKILELTDKIANQ